MPLGYLHVCDDAGMGRKERVIQKRLWRDVVGIREIYILFQQVGGRCLDPANGYGRSTIHNDETEKEE